MPTFSTIVVSIRGHFKSANNDNYCQMIIIGGIAENDHDIVGFSRVFHNEYTKINNAFKSAENILMIFKNIIRAWPPQAPNGRGPRPPADFFSSTRLPPPVHPHPRPVFAPQGGPF